MRLAGAHGEKEVSAMLEDPFFKAMEWRPLGGSKANYGIVHTQQSDPVNALCEKPVNSMDHVLLKACRLVGDDPEGPRSPRTMRKAVEKYLGVKEGDFDALPGDRADEMARNVMIIADGPKERPNIAVADRGEGQRPEDFESTLLSLQRGNKNAIRFVQGKYNMGGTGVLPFCASGYELIVSRRCAELTAAEGGSDEWGFTLVREKPDVPEGNKTTWYEFLAVPGGTVPTAPAGPLPLLPAGGKLEDGCYIKMFGYDLPGESAITSSLYREINSRLYAPMMPIMMVDARTCFGNRGRAQRAGTVVRGNRGRVARDGGDHIRLRREIQFKIRGFGKHLIEVTVFRHALTYADASGRVPGRGRGAPIGRFRSKSEAVMLTQNGQTHATISEARLKSETGLESLAPHMMVHMDLTGIPTTKTKIFMASRDRVRKSADYKTLEGAIMHDLRHDDQLRALDAEYKTLDDSASVHDESMDQAIVNAVRRNPYIADLLRAGGTAVEGGGDGDSGDGDGTGGGDGDGTGGGDGDGTGGGGTGGDPVPEFVPRYVPTYLRVRGVPSGEEQSVVRKQIPHDGGTSYVYLETDAPNDYTTREADAGKLISQFPDASDGSCHDPYDGVVRVKIRSKGAQFGDAGELIVVLTRPNAMPLRCIVQLYYGAPKGDDGDDEDGPGGPGDDPDKDAGVNVPELRWVARDQWEAQEWGEESVSKVKSDAILINKDCRYLAEFVKSHPDADPAEAMRRFGFSVYVASLFLDRDLQGDENYDDKFGMAIAVVAKSCLPASYDRTLPDMARTARAAAEE